jgi:hypothetical protein
MRILRLILLILFPCVASAYSVLSHEAIIDAAWDVSIQPLLKAKFPNATASDLVQAHAYAYGGAIIQDLGYYPSGSHLFSDLTHYIRSGTFVRNLIGDATTLNDYAFALGALAHYAADNEGHSIAVNHAVPLLYPKLARKYGPLVTYEDDPSAHLRTEFAFDVVQVARGFYASEAYHNFIGFAVSQSVLQTAFRQTYCVDMRELFKNLDHSLSTYRHVVSQTIPKATKVAWAMKQKDIQKHSPSMVRRQFIYNISRSSYEKEWGRDYEKPGAGARFLAFLLKLIPHIGPLRALSFKTPTPEAENLFTRSFDATLSRYRALLKQVGEGTLQLADTNLDTGQPADAATYRLAQQAKTDLTQLQAKDGVTACQ